MSYRNKEGPLIARSLNELISLQAKVSVFKVVFSDISGIISRFHWIQPTKFAVLNAQLECSKLRTPELGQTSAKFSIGYLNLERLRSSEATYRCLDGTDSLIVCSIVLLNRLSTMADTWPFEISSLSTFPIITVSTSSSVEVPFGPRVSDTETVEMVSIRKFRVRIFE